MFAQDAEFFLILNKLLANELNAVELVGLNKSAFLDNDVVNSHKSYFSLQNKIVDFIAQRLSFARYQERQRLAAELHDDLSQQLMAIKIAASMLMNNHRDESNFELVEGVLSGIDNLASSLKRLTKGLQFEPPDYFVLEVALEKLLYQMFSSSCVEYKFERSGDISRVAPAVQLVFYRVAQEAINNIYKHAHANNILIKVLLEGDSLGLIIEDDGLGFNIAESMLGSSLGLKSMHKRAEALLGELKIQSRLGVGTQVSMFVNCARFISSGKEVLL